MSSCCTNAGPSACCCSTACFSRVLSIFFGLWLAYLGFSKWIFLGPVAFEGFIQNNFGQTWLASIPFLLTLTTWGILIAEPLFGLWLLSGRCLRCAWLATATLMLMLTFGQTIIMKYDVVADNWQYCVLCLAGAATARACGMKTECCDSSAAAKSGCCDKTSTL
jgi:uncharacterized membrane protein YphA (DoxX/SURF4 family)